MISQNDSSPGLCLVIAAVERLAGFQHKSNQEDEGQISVPVDCEVVQPIDGTSKGSILHSQGKDTPLNSAPVNATGKAVIASDETLLSFATQCGQALQDTQGRRHPEIECALLSAHGDAGANAAPAPENQTPEPTTGSHVEQVPALTAQCEAPEQIAAATGNTIALPDGPLEHSRQRAAPLGPSVSSTDDAADKTAVIAAAAASGLVSTMTASVVDLGVRSNAVGEDLPGQLDGRVVDKPEPMIHVFTVPAIDVDDAVHGDGVGFEGIPMPELTRSDSPDGLSDEQQAGITKHSKRKGHVKRTKGVRATLMDASAFHTPLKTTNNTHKLQAVFSPTALKEAAEPQSGEVDSQQIAAAAAAGDSSLLHAMAENNKTTAANHHANQAGRESHAAEQSIKQANVLTAEALAALDTSPSRTDNSSQGVRVSLSNWTHVDSAGGSDCEDDATSKAQQVDNNNNNNKNKNNPVDDYVPLVTMDASVPLPATTTDQPPKVDSPKAGVFALAFPNSGFVDLRSSVTFPTAKVRMSSSHSTPDLSRVLAVSEDDEKVLQGSPGSPKPFEKSRHAKPGQHSHSVAVYPSQSPVPKLTLPGTSEVQNPDVDGFSAQGSGTLSEASKVETAGDEISIKQAVDGAPACHAALPDPMWSSSEAAAGPTPLPTDTASKVSEQQDSQAQQASMLHLTSKYTALDASRAEHVSATPNEGTNSALPDVAAGSPLLTSGDLDTSCQLINSVPLPEPISSSISNKYIANDCYQPCDGNSTPRPCSVDVLNDGIQHVQLVANSSPVGVERSSAVSAPNSPHVFKVPRGVVVGPASPVPKTSRPASLLASPLSSPRVSRSNPSISLCTLTPNQALSKPGAGVVDPGAGVATYTKAEDDAHDQKTTAENNNTQLGRGITAMLTGTPTNQGPGTLSSSSINTTCPVQDRSPVGVVDGVDVVGAAKMATPVVETAPASPTRYNSAPADVTTWTLLPVAPSSHSPTTKASSSAPSSPHTFKVPRGVVVGPGSPVPNTSRAASPLPSPRSPSPLLFRSPSLSPLQSPRNTTVAAGITTAGDLQTFKAVGEVFGDGACAPPSPAACVGAVNTSGSTGQGQSYAQSNQKALQHNVKRGADLSATPSPARYAQVTHGTALPVLGEASAGQGCGVVVMSTSFSVLTTSPFAGPASDDDNSDDEFGSLSVAMPHLPPPSSNQQVHQQAVLTKLDLVPGSATSAMPQNTDSGTCTVNGAIVTDKQSYLPVAPEVLRTRGDMPLASSDTLPVVAPNKAADLGLGDKGQGSADIDEVADKQETFPTSVACVATSVPSEEGCRRSRPTFESEDGWPNDFFAAQAVQTATIQEDETFVALDFGAPSPISTPTTHAATMQQHHHHLGLPDFSPALGHSHATPYGNTMTGPGSAVFDYDLDPALFTNGSIGSSSLGGFSSASTPLTPPSMSQSWYAGGSRTVHGARTGLIPSVPLGMLATSNLQPGDDITKSPWYKIAQERANRMLADRFRASSSSYIARPDADNSNAAQGAAASHQLPPLPGVTGIRSGQGPSSCHSSPGPAYYGRERPYPSSSTGLGFPLHQQPFVGAAASILDEDRVAVATARPTPELQPGSPASSIASDFSVPDSASQLGRYHAGNAYQYGGAYTYRQPSADVSSVRSSLNSGFSADGGASQSGLTHGHTAAHMARHHGSRKVGGSKHNKYQRDTKSLVGRYAPAAGLLTPTNTRIMHTVTNSTISIPTGPPSHPRTSPMPFVMTPAGRNSSQDDDTCKTEMHMSAEACKPDVAKTADLTAAAAPALSKVDQALPRLTRDTGEDQICV